MKYIDFINEQIGDLTDKIIVITGATSGIGFSAARYLAYKNASIIMACRNINKAAIAKEKILKEVSNAKIDILEYDQASLHSIDEFVENLKAKYSHIDSLVLNAGVYHPRKNSTTKDGLPLTIGTNFVGIYHLISTLKPYLLNCQKPRLVFVSSILHNNGKTKNGVKYLHSERHSSAKQYAVSKRMLMTYAHFLETEFASQFVITYMHPGVAATGIISEEHSAYPHFIASLGNKFLHLFANSPDKSALGIALLAGKDDIKNGEYLVPRGFAHLTGFPKEVKNPISSKDLESFKEYQSDLNMLIDDLKHSND